MGLGLLSKYTNLMQCLCWAVFFLLVALPARRHLSRPGGPYLALLYRRLMFTANTNLEQSASLDYYSSRGQRRSNWPALAQNFYAGIFAVGNGFPASCLFHRRDLGGSRILAHGPACDPLQLYLFGMGAPLFLDVS